MPAFPITSFQVITTPTGSRIKGTTTGGPFDTLGLDLAELAALLLVINGPNPECDPHRKIFYCGSNGGGHLMHEALPVDVKNIPAFRDFEAQE